MNAPTETQHSIFDHPESKIAFLEETLVGKDWRVSIVYPGTDAQRTESKTALTRRGIIVHERIDAKGQHVFDLHHPGKGGKFGDLTRELGTAGGAWHAITHPALPLSMIGHAGKDVGNWFNKRIHDPAQANGLINTAAEFFLSSSSFGAKYGKFSDPRNAFMSLAGISWLAQSLIYLFVAKSNEDTTLDQFKKKLAATAKQGGDVTQLSYDANRDQEKPPGAFVRFLRRYPVQIGAVMNNLGMLFYLAHAHLQKKYSQSEFAKYAATPEVLAYKRGELRQYEKQPEVMEHLYPNVTKYRDADFYINKHGILNKSGYQSDRNGALTSLVGWSVLMIPSKKHDETKPPPSNIFTRAWAKCRENTPMVAGWLTLAASSQRLMGATAKGNPLSKIGESIYIGGDVALMFTDSHEYGGRGLNVEKLSTTMAEHINAMPVVLGTKAQDQFVQNSVNYLLEKNLADIKAKPDAKDPKREELVARSKALAQVLSRKVRHIQNEHLDSISDIAAGIVAKFPDSARGDAKAQLCHALKQMPWIHATTEELAAALGQSLKKLPPSPSQAKPVSLSDVKEEVMQLISVVPGLDIGASVAVLHDALASAIHGKGGVEASSQPVLAEATYKPSHAPTHTIPANAPRQSQVLVPQVEQALSS